MSVDATIPVVDHTVEIIPELQAGWPNLLYGICGVLFSLATPSVHFMLDMGRDSGILRTRSLLSKYICSEVDLSSFAPILSNVLYNICSDVGPVKCI